MGAGEATPPRAGIASKGYVPRLVNHGEGNYIDGKGIISLDWRGSGDTSSGNPPQKEASHAENCPCTTRNMFGDTIIAQIQNELKIWRISRLLEKR
jgi:hypothetical protein